MEEIISTDITNKVKNKQLYKKRIQIISSHVMTHKQFTWWIMYHPQSERWWFGDCTCSTKYSLSESY